MKLFRQWLSGKSMSLFFAYSHNEFAQLATSLALAHEDAGGFVTFNGRVRRFNRDQEVAFLYYEAYVRLAQSLFNALEDEAKKRFCLLETFALHRLERVERGEDAVLIGVAAAHRDAAFKGARFLIDELKTKIPIWKKEIYKDGSYFYGEDCGCVGKGAYE